MHELSQKASLLLRILNSQKPLKGWSQSKPGDSVLGPRQCTRGTRGRGRKLTAALACW